MSMASRNVRDEQRRELKEAIDRLRSASRKERKPHYVPVKSTGQVACQTVKRVPCFMELPAELRNQIYEYLIEDIDTNVGSKTILLRPRTEFPKYWRKKNPHRGNHYSLNQVCRATRREFGPLYVSRVTHRIRVDETLFKRVLQTLYLEPTANNDFVLVPKKIEIELGIPLVQDPRINIMPLLNLSLGSADLQCSFLNKFGSMPELDKIFWNHTVAWKAAITQDLLAVVLYAQQGTTTTVELVFRDDANREFVNQIPQGRRRDAPPSMRAYLTKLGAVYNNTWDPRVGVWNTQARVNFAVSKKNVRKVNEGVGGEIRDVPDAVSSDKELTETIE